MKDYYQILRVNRQASDVEIKRAYRRLAIVFHPDKNPSEEASALFQEINEAHEILMDRQKREQYDFLLRGGQRTFRGPEPEYREHRDPAYRRRHQTGYRRPSPRVPDHLLMMAHSLKYFRTVCFIGLGWCGFLSFDFVLPHRISDEIVLPESNRIYNWRYNHIPYVVVTNKVHQFPVSRDATNYFPKGSHVQVKTSRILNLLVQVEAEKQAYTIYALNSVYRNFIYAPFMLLVFSTFGLTLRNGIEFRFSFGLALCMVLLINFVFLFSSIL